MSFDSLLNRTVVIQGRTRTRDKGSVTENWAVVVPGYRCRIYYIKPRLVRRDSGEEVSIDIRASGYLDSRIVEGCLLVDGSDKYKIITAAPKYGPSAIHHVEYDLVRVFDIGV